VAARNASVPAKGSRWGSSLSFARIAYKVRMRGERGKRSPLMMSSPLSGPLPQGECAETETGRSAMREFAREGALESAPQAKTLARALSANGILKQAGLPKRF